LPILQISTLGLVYYLFINPYGKRKRNNVKGIAAKSKVEQNLLFGNHLLQLTAKILKEKDIV